MPARRSLTLALALLLVAAIPARATGFPTITVVDSIWPGENSSSAMQNSARFGNYLYFLANDQASGQELWRTNGTTTTRVADINVGIGDSYPHSFVTLGNYLYFAANDGTGEEVWRTDGTTTTLVKDVRNESSQQNYLDIVVFGNYIYFAADDGTGDGVELWRTDGTRDGTKLFKEIYDETAEPSSSTPEQFMVANNRLYFIADDGIHGRELWSTDGTVLGTNIVRDIREASSNAEIREFAPSGPYLYFSADDGIHGREIWRTDGTLLGTILLKDINVRPEESSNPRALTAFNGAVYFQAYSFPYGTELWRTDGTVLGTELVKDINQTFRLHGRPGASSDPFGFTAFGGYLYFAADDGIYGSELWRTNGTTVGTTLVANINTTVGVTVIPAVPDFGSTPDLFTPIGDYLYFRANDGGAGKLWRLSAVGAVESALLPGTNSWIGCQCTNAMTSLNGRLFFVMNSDLIGLEFAYLDEPTWVMPSTNRNGSPWSATLVVLAALTAAAGATVYTREHQN